MSAPATAPSNSAGAKAVGGGAALKGGTLRCEGSRQQPLIFFDSANGRTYAVNKPAVKTGTDSIKKIYDGDVSALEEQGKKLC